MRIILYTGKGGVGKTSIAAATAVRAAELGYRTVVISTDAAHSLADSLDMPLSADPVPVASNLWGQEIDVLKELKGHWSQVREWLVSLMRWQGADALEAEEMAVLPGMEELVGLLYISRYAESQQYEVVIVDCAPTGETLRLLSFPDMARWYMQRLFPIERRLAAALGPIVRGITGMPVPGRAVFDTVETLFHDLEKMRSVLSDPEMSSVRLVVNPEKMVIKETQRTFTYLNLYGYCTDLLVCNRVLPASLADSFFDAWKLSQAKYLSLINESFDPIPIIRAPLMGQEVVGLDRLKEMAQAVFGEQDPTQLFYKGQAQTVAREAGGYVMTIAVPFTALADISIIRGDGELTMQVGHYRRNIILPRALAELEVAEAKKEGANLKLRFQTIAQARQAKTSQGGKA
ncbi:MAG: ArsA family ATPase [Chloroflexi bacterium]|nr:ArsA family ATPase [Chloroflexota bacterium]